MFRTNNNNSETKTESETNEKPVSSSITTTRVNTTSFGASTGTPITSFGVTTWDFSQSIERDRSPTRPKPFGESFERPRRVVLPTPSGFERPTEFRALVDSTTQNNNGFRFELPNMPTITNVNSSDSSSTSNNRLISKNVPVTILFKNINTTNTRPIFIPATIIFNGLYGKTITNVIFNNGLSNSAILEMISSQNSTAASTGGFGMFGQAPTATNTGGFGFGSPAPTPNNSDRLISKPIPVTILFEEIDTTTVRPVPISVPATIIFNNIFDKSTVNVIFDNGLPESLEQSIMQS